MYWNYVSCLLTIISTLLVGKRLWHGWMLAGLNSVIICFIGFQTRQWGFIPANLFCLAIYAHNIRKWRGLNAEPLNVESTVTGSAISMDAELQAISISARVSPGKAPSWNKPGRFRKNYGSIVASSRRLRTSARVKARTNRGARSL
jgi:hypothetical protein